MLMHPKQFKNTEHAASLAPEGARQHLSRLMNPTTHVLESRVAHFEGGARASAKPTAHRNLRRLHGGQPRAGGR